MATIERARFALNRSIAPSLGLADFCGLARAAGITKVELRNDHADPDPLDGLAPGAAARLLADHGIEVISINAIVGFNAASLRAPILEKTDRALEVARAVRCPALVLCPSCDPADGRSEERRLAETVEGLQVLGPRLSSAGVEGWVEPLGYPHSSLRSLRAAERAIRSSGLSGFRLLYDTFHHFLGPDRDLEPGEELEPGRLGLVHVSGVEAPGPETGLRDAQRELVGPADRVGTRRQLHQLDRLGYRGAISFEPFLPAVQQLGTSEMAAALERSMEYLGQEA